MTKDSIRKWLSEESHSRKWLAEKCGVTQKTLNNWLGSERPVPQKALRMIEKLMREDQMLDVKARLVLEFTPEEFEKLCEAALKDKMTIQKWAEAKLNRLV